MSKTYNIRQIKWANKHAGGHFFDRETMRFFNSLVIDHVYQGPGGVFFVTSERMDDDSPTVYGVREFHPETGRVTTVDDATFDHLGGAVEAAYQHAGIDSPETIRQQMVALQAGQ